MSIKLYFVHLMMARNRKKIKKRPPLLGQPFTVPRNGKPGVEVILYRPEASEHKLLPVMYNVHGGAWVGSDASQLDTQSKNMAKRLSAFVDTINYKKVDERPFPYAQYEIHDTALYFAEHAEEYGLDQKRFTLIGYSAGGHLCAGAAILLKQSGFPLNSQVLCYPFLDFGTFDLGQMVGGAAEDKANSQLKMFNELFFPGNMDKRQPLLSPALATEKDLKGLAPAELIVCGNDALYPHAVTYHQKLMDAGVSSEFKQYEHAIHGFLEVNHPEYMENAAKSPEQEAIMQECERYLAQRLPIRWGYDD